LARVIERPRDFEAPFTLDQMQPDVWMLQEPGFSDLMKVYTPPIICVAEQQELGNTSIRSCAKWEICHICHIIPSQI
jgi:hypothetical protein